MEGSNSTNPWSSSTTEIGISPNGTNSSNLTSPYCPKEWNDAWSKFNNYHPNPLVMILCIVGCFTNVFNLIVFTRKCMKSPTITILTMLAVSDFCCVSRRFLYEILQSQFDPLKTDTSTRTTILIFRFLESLFHFWSVFLTVAVAVWRYVMTRFPFQSKTLCTEQTARWTVLIIFIASGIFAFLSRVLGEDVTKTKDTRENYGNLVHFWISSLVEKLFPCFILVFVSLRLRQSLIATKKKRSHMTVKSKEKAHADKGHFNRTTRMLLFAVILFLVTELPSGIVALITAILRSNDLRSSFYRECFRPIRFLMGMLELVSSTANFFIYYSTGANFRLTFLNHVDGNFPQVLNIQKILGENLKFTTSVRYSEHSSTAGVGIGTLSLNRTQSSILSSTSINKFRDRGIVKTPSKETEDLKSSPDISTIRNV